MAHAPEIDHLAGRPAGGTQARILTGCCVGSFFSISSVIIYPFGVFAGGIAGEMGVSKLEATRLIAPALLLTIVMQPVIGWAVDRWPRRNVALCAMGLLAAAVALIAVAPANRASLTFFISVAIMLSAIASPAVYNAYLSQTFDSRRGFAMGVSTAFTGLAIAIIPAVSARLIQHVGWRASYGFIALAVISSLLANAALFPRASIPTVAARTRHAGDVLRLLVRDPVFWIIATLFFLIPVSANAVPIYLPLMLGHRGASPEVSALSLTVLGLTMIVSRPLLGFLIDRWPSWIVLVVMIAGSFTGSLALLFTSGIAAGLIAAVGFGIGIGGEFVALGYIVSRTFGVTHFGLVYGWISVAVACGIAGGPLLVGALSSDDRFDPALYMIAFASLAALAMTMVLNRFPRSTAAAALAT